MADLSAWSKYGTDLSTLLVQEIRAINAAFTNDRSYDKEEPEEDILTKLKRVYND